MPFNSLQFLVFFPASALLFFITPQRFRIKTLLALSCIFYMSFNPAFILLVFFIIAIDYFLSIKIEQASLNKRKKIYFVTGLLFNILILVFFKYFNFLSGNFLLLFGLAQTGQSTQILDILLPIGISFYIFKSISYLIEVYRGNIKAEKKASSLSAYILFFPELLAGPIDRPQTLIPQFLKTHKLNYTDLKEGIKLFAWGLFLKTVIADRLGILVDKIYYSPMEYSGIHLIIATIFFAIQIYADFAGYSYIAIGCGRIMGFNLMKNFDHPYFSETISGFWSRWHISLSTWLRDYLFLPLTYSAARRIQKFKNLKIRTDIASYCAGIFITLFIAGLWHGAGWNFVIWGLIIAFYLMISVITSKLRKKLRKKIGINNSGIFRYARIIFIFSLMCIAWIFFRANNAGDGWYILTHLFSGFGNISFSGSYFQTELSQNRIGLNNIDFFVSVLLIIFLFFIEYLQVTKKFNSAFMMRPRFVKVTIFLVLLFIILLFGNFSSEQFIYFQF